MIFPKEALEILDILKKHGYEGFFVGGCVRDRLLKIESYDFDICTNAKPEQIKLAFKNFQIIDIGKKLGTILIKKNNLSYEITPYRLEADYQNHRHPNKIFFSDNVRDDIKRRDFTINAICYNQEKGLIDYYNGQNDLKNKIIKTVENPYRRFKEDSLRILRALRFKSKLNFKIEKETLNAMEKLAPNLKVLSTYRISDEFLKILMGKYCLKVLEENKNILEHIFKIEACDKKITKFNDAKKRLAYFLSFQKRPKTILKKINMSKKDKDFILEIIKVTKISFLEEKYFIKHLNLNKNVDEILDFFSIYYDKNLCTLYESLKHRIVKKLEINGNDILELGYKKEDINKIKKKLINLINKESLNNEKKVLLNYLNKSDKVL